MTLAQRMLAVVADKLKVNQVQLKVLVELEVVEVQHKLVQMVMLVQQTLAVAEAVRILFLVVNKVEQVEVVL
jgi:hypothetical protein